MCKFIGLTSPLPRLLHGTFELGLPLHRYGESTFPPGALGTSWWFLETPTLATYTLVETIGLIVSVSMMLGVLSRLSSLAVFVTSLWLLLVDPAGFKHNLWAMAVFAGLLALSPCGASHSVDAFVRRRLQRFADVFAMPTTTWILPLRLVQLQVGVIYLFSTLRKFNDGWSTGHLLRTTVQQMPEQLEALGLSVFTPLLTWPGWYIAGAWLTVGLEGFLAFGFFSQRWRPWAFAIGIVLHVWIDIALDVGAYSLVMFAAYVAFIEPVPRAHTVHLSATDRLRFFVRVCDWLARFNVVASEATSGHVIVVDSAGIVVATDRAAIIFVLRRLPLTFAPAFVFDVVDQQRRHRAARRQAL